MGDETKKLPTVGDVAAKIAAAVHNSGQNVIITDDDLRNISQREKLREGFIKPVFEALTASGFNNVRGAGVATVFVPQHDAIPFSEALETSKEAQADGMRPTPGGCASDVMDDDGTFK